jgi:hypothetical protein
MALNHARLPVPPLAAAQVATDSANGGPWRLEATQYKVILDQILDQRSTFMAIGLVGGLKGAAGS